MGGRWRSASRSRTPERVASLVLSSSFARVVTPGSHWRARYVDQPAVLAALRFLPEPRALAFASGSPRARLGVRSALRPHVLGLVRHSVRRVPVGMALERVRLAFRHDARADLPRIACPALVIVGERESAAYRDASAELARLIPRARLEISPGAGHLHPLSNPEWLADTMTAWLKR
jgi:pimeloyl-ACP methyl ester carboxylesterase